MTGEPMTATEVAQKLADLGKQLNNLVGQLDDAERDAVNKREDYTQARAKAFLAATGAMDVRAAVATEQTHGERLAAELAEAEVRGLKRRVDSTKVRIDIGRSYGSAVKAEIALGGVGDAP